MMQKSTGVGCWPLPEAEHPLDSSSKAAFSSLSDLSNELGTGSSGSVSPDT